MNVFSWRTNRRMPKNDEIYLDGLVKIFGWWNEAIRDRSMLHAKYRFSPDGSYLSSHTFPLAILSLGKLIHARVSSTPHMMPTLTYLQTSVLPVHKAQLPLPKVPQAPRLWNQTPHLTHIIAPSAVFPICCKGYCPLCSFARIQAENIDIA